LIGCDKSSIFTYKLYKLNADTNVWSLFSNSSFYYTSGPSNNQLTVLENLFSDYPTQIVWKIELIVNVASNLVPNDTYEGTTSMQIYVNFSPIPGVCSVSPAEGNTTSLFYIICNSWTDPDGSVTNYAFYGKYFILLEGK
jgi:hypothetical protein